MTPSAEREVTPVVILGKSLKPDSKRRLAVKLWCPAAAGTCEGWMQVKAGHRVLGKKNFLLNGGTTSKVRVTLSRKLLKAIRGAPRANVFVFSRDATGFASMTQARLKLLGR